jgi:glycosyltransferase involved in cell wall biosynthesis
MRGGQWQVLFLLRGLRERGHQNKLLCRQGSPLALRAAEEGFELADARLWAVLGHRRRLDLIHAHDARGHTLAALAGARPLVVSRRVAFPVGRGFFSRWKYRQGRCFIAVSNYVKKVMMDGGIDSHSIRVVYDGVPCLEPAPRGGRILAPASDDPQKGTELAREAAALAGVEVEFSSDLIKDLPGSNLFLYLTHQEGLGSGALLAMSAGVPVIASAVGGLPEIVKDGVTGLLTSNSASAAAIRMRRMIEDKALAGRLAAAARRQVLEKFSLTIMVDLTEQVYKECLA